MTFLKICALCEGIGDYRVKFQQNNVMFLVTEREYKILNNMVTCSDVFTEHMYQNCSSALLLICNKSCSHCKLLSFQ